MKVLLIQPPIQDFYQTSLRTQPIGLAYLAASLKYSGHEVEILNCQTGKKRKIPVPPELSYLHGFYPFDDRSPFKLYTGYYHFGMDWSEIRKKVEDSNANFYGISSSFTPYHGEAVEIARMIKQRDRRKIVVMGGAHVSCDPAGVLGSPWVDYIVMGEGEERFPLLLEKIEQGDLRGLQEMDGVGYRIEGEVRINPLKTFIEDIERLPFPSRELLDLDQYRIRKKRSTMLITSRGCPHGCAYCSAHLVVGASFRARSPEDILREMVLCRDRYGIRVFDIEDDNFTFDQARAKQLMKLIIGTFGEEKIELSAMNGVSFASLDEEVLKLMKRAGFHTVNLSFVSTDSATRERMKRPKPMTGFDSIFEKAEQAGLHVIAYAILGMPGQTVEEMAESLVSLMEKRVLIGPSIYYPTPGTPLFERCKNMGILPPHASQWRSSALPVQTEEFNRLDLITLFRLARVINFIKGKINEGEFEEEITWKEFFQMLKEKNRGAGEEASVRDAPGREKLNFSWVNLLLNLFEERVFSCLSKDFKGTYSVSKIESSKKVLALFFKKAWNRPILRSRPVME